MTSKQEQADEFVDEVLAVAVAVERVLDGHGVVPVLMAIGWVVGAYAAERAPPETDGLKVALDIIGREAKRKFDGVRDGSWR